MTIALWIIGYFVLAFVGCVFVGKCMKYGMGSDEEDEDGIMDES